MDIRQTAHLNEYDQDPYVKEFRIYISDKLTSDEARVLPAPWLKYHDARKEECLPRDGQWDAYRLLLLKTGLKLQSMLDWCALNLIGAVPNVQLHPFAAFVRILKCKEFLLFCFAGTPKGG
ncbi:hypothetical protein ACQ4PT_049251 [Festuca glaucescens]